MRAWCMHEACFSAGRRRRLLEYANSRVDTSRLTAAGPLCARSLLAAAPAPGLHTRRSFTMPPRRAVFSDSLQVGGRVSVAGYEGQISDGCTKAELARELPNESFAGIVCVAN